MSDVFYKLSFGSFEYPVNSDMEAKTDRFLDFFARIIALSEIGAIAKSDLKYLGHEFWVISNNGPLQQYFEYLDSLCSKGNLSSTATFSRLRTVARHYGSLNVIAGTGNS